MLESEPFNDVWFLSLTSELHGSPLGVQIVEGVFPGLSGVGIKFPTVSLLRGGPVWYLESLEQGSWSSIEVDISNSLEEGFGMEVLSVDVILNVWLFVELIAIEVFNSNTYYILLN